METDAEIKHMVEETHRGIGRGAGQASNKAKFIYRLKKTGNYFLKIYFVIQMNSKV